MRETGIRCLIAGDNDILKRIIDLSYDITFCNRTFDSIKNLRTVSTVFRDQRIDDFRISRTIENQRSIVLNIFADIAGQVFQCFIR
jgi:hypothetical protein